MPKKEANPANKIATRSPPEPDWVALQSSLGLYYADRAKSSLRDAAFTHVYEAIRYLARQVVSRKLGSAQGSVTEVSESIVDKVFRKSFTDIAASYDPGRSTSFRTWVTTVLTNEFINWCRQQKGGLKLVSLNKEDTSELEKEWRQAVTDIADCDLYGVKRPGIVSELIEKESALTLEQKTNQVNAAIDALPEKFRVTILFDKKKETQKQAADRLGISLPTFKRNRTQAIAIVKEWTK